MSTFQELRQMLSQDMSGEVAEFSRALNQAIRAVRGEMFYAINPPPTITLAVNTWEYSLSSITSIARIRALMMADSTGEHQIPVPGNHWYVIAGPKLVFDDRMFDPVATRTVRLISQAIQADLSSDSDDLNIDEEFVLAKARELMHMARTTPAAPDQTAVNANATAHLQIAQYWGRVAAAARMTSTYRPDPSSRRIPGVY